jgi:hypothetical protein
MPAMNVTKADRVFVGAALAADKSPIRSGVEVAMAIVEAFAPTAAVANNIAASQSVGLGANFILNGALLSAGRVILDVPRNVVGAWTNTAILTIRGKDQYGAPLVEVTASGTSHTGNKAFKEITSITSSAAITGATIGTGGKIGLKYRPVVGGFIRGRFGEDTADAGTYATPIRTTSTGTTNDVRGTYAPAGTLNGSNVITVQYFAVGGPQDVDTFGIAQFATG